MADHLRRRHPWSFLLHAVNRVRCGWLAAHMLRQKSPPTPPASVASQKSQGGFFLPHSFTCKPGRHSTPVPPMLLSFRRGFFSLRDVHRIVCAPTISKQLTLSPPIPLRFYNVPYWSNPSFLIFDIRALWRSGLSARPVSYTHLTLPTNREV